MATPQEIKVLIDDMVSDTACCDRSGCRCWQAVEDIKMVRDYCDGEIIKHDARVNPRSVPESLSVEERNR